jgi:CBS domain-containing protein
VTVHVSRPHLAEPGESVLEAARRMRERRVGTLVIVDDVGKPVGLVTDRDLVLRVVAAGGDPRAISVGEVMTERPKTVTESTPIESALSLMRSASFRRLPTPEGHPGPRCVMGPYS